ncbi:phage terminase small subunit [Sinorhizobium fredii]
MPILKNARHERFAQALAEGMTATDAYTEAGYKGGGTAASRLSTNVNISSSQSQANECK